MWLSRKVANCTIGLSYILERSFLYKHAANLVTILGLILVGYAVFLLWLSPQENKMLILVLFTAGSITDFLDGQIARKLGITSQLGSDLDKARDKFYICNIFVWLAREIMQDIFNNSAAMVFILFMITLCLLIEVLLVIMWIRCRIKKIDASARKSGQRKMALYFIAAIWWFGCWNFQGYISLTTVYFIFGLVITLASVFAYYSLQTYYQRYDQQMKKIKMRKAS